MLFRPFDYSLQSEPSLLKKFFQRHEARLRRVKADSWQGEHWNLLAR
jgi:hypothetical protein